MIITLRADFYPRLLEPAIARLVEGHQTYWLKSPDEQALVAAMYWPAAVNGYRFEDHNLFVQILRDAAGALPLLSYALEQLAAQAYANHMVINWSDYRDIGGVQGVIQHQVEQALGEVSPETLESALNNLFRRLVTVNEEGAPARRPAYFNPDDGTWTPEAIRLKEALVDKRLLFTDSRDGRPVIEIAHEALLSSWDQLREWIARARNALLLLQRVESAACEWRDKRAEAHSEDNKLEVDRHRLWRQDRLDEVDAALQLLGQSPQELSGHARQFIRPEVERLKEELNYSFIAHERRAAIGERLAELGDRRAGVGLGEDGLPDIDWCAVPGGRVKLFDRDQVLGEFAVEPFFIARYPITLTQFKVFLKEAYYQRQWWQGLPVQPQHHPPYPQTPEIGNHPAQFVSWYQAIAFCNWLSHKLGYVVRLPTEWEWVQAATGGRADYLYPWGPEWDPARANHKEGLYRLVSVGMYPQGQSPVGACDMSGNMYEWCLNEYDHPDNVALSDKPRTTRGGAFFTMPPGIDVREQLSIRHRLRDNADGTGDRGRRVAVCMRLACKTTKRI